MKVEGVGARMNNKLIDAVIESLEADAKALIELYCGRADLDPSRVERALRVANVAHQLEACSRVVLTQNIAAAREEETRTWDTPS